MRNKEKNAKEPQALSSYVSCGPLVKISSKTHVNCAVYTQIAVRTSFAQICRRSRPIFPAFVEDRIPTTSNQKTLESNRVCRARHTHEINAFRERSRRITYVRTSSYVVRSKTCSGMYKYTLVGKNTKFTFNKRCNRSYQFSPREFASTGTTSRCSYLRIL